MSVFRPRVDKEAAFALATSHGFPDPQSFYQWLTTGLASGALRVEFTRTVPDSGTPSPPPITAPPPPPIEPVAEGLVDDW